MSSRPRLSKSASPNPDDGECEREQAQKLIAATKAFHDFHAWRHGSRAGRLATSEGHREGRVNLRDSFARLDNANLAANVHISPYSHSGYGS